MCGLTALASSTPGPAATPPAGTIDDTNTSVSWQGQPYTIGHVVAVPDQCPPAADPANVICDHFNLTVNVPPSWWQTHTGGADVMISWGSADDDFDLYIFDENGTEVARSASGGTTFERTFIPDASGTYEVRVVPFLIASAPLVSYEGDATFVSVSGGGTPNPTRSTGGLAFGPATVTDAQRTEGEPLNYIDPKDGSEWETGPWGFSTAQVFVHRSTDGGDQFNIVSPNGLRPNPFVAGGGDSDITTDDQLNAYFVDLEGLVEIGCGVSNDGGNNWRENGACVQSTLDDRQWVAPDNGINLSLGPGGAADNTIFHGYREELGTHIYSTPGSTGPLDPVGGLVYTNSADTPLPLSAEVRCGQLRFDPSQRNLYYPCSAADHVELTIGHVAVGQRTGIHYSNVELPLSPGGGGVDELFPLVAADKAGNVYAVWVDTNDHNVYYSASPPPTFDGSGNASTSWSTPRQVNGNDANSNVMPWAQAGAPGKLVVGWYGTSSRRDSDNMPSWYNDREAATAFKWFGYVAVISGANGSAPSFAQAKFTEKPMHYGQICTGGIGCTISGGDRTMADYFSFYLSPKDGSIHVDYNDTTSQHHGAHVFDERQLTGPNALFGGTISKPIPSNPVSDPKGDAQSPHYSPTGTGANAAHLDFTKLELSQPTASVLRVKMTLAAPPVPGATPSGGTPPTKTSTLWWTRFQALSLGDEGEEAYRIFYVGAESNGGTGPPTFFAGSGDAAQDAIPGDGCTTTTPENCKIVQYPSEVPANGTVSGNTITIDVPLQSGFGPNRPIKSLLYNVTALSGGRTNSSQDVYADVDATRPFDFPIATGGGGGGGGGGGTGCKITGGGAIPGTGTADGIFSLNPQGNLKGKVAYRDDGAAVSFRSTRLLSVDCSTGRVTGTGVNGNHVVSFTVDVEDNGEPGTTDRLGITLSDGYMRAKSTLKRGNIQVHS
jgi:hypothetical protein